MVPNHQGKRLVSQTMHFGEHLKLLNIFQFSSLTRAPAPTQFSGSFPSSKYWLNIRKLQSCFPKPSTILGGCLEEGWKLSPFSLAGLVRFVRAAAGQNGAASGNFSFYCQPPALVVSGDGGASAEICSPETLELKKWKSRAASGCYICLEEHQVHQGGHPRLFRCVYKQSYWGMLAHQQQLQPKILLLLFSLQDG